MLEFLVEHAAYCAINNESCFNIIIRFIKYLRTFNTFKVWVLLLNHFWLCLEETSATTVLFDPSYLNDRAMETHNSLVKILSHLPSGLLPM